MTLRAPLYTRIPRRDNIPALYDPGQPSALLTELRGQDRFFGPAGMAPDYDWPNPRSRRNDVSLYRWEVTNLLETTLVPVGTAPFKGRLAENPTRRRHPSALLQWEDFFREFEEPPPGLFDSQMPVRRRHPTALLTWTDPLKLNLRGQDKFFGGAGEPPRNYDFPNPLQPRWSISLKFAANDLLQSTLAPVVSAPFTSTLPSNPLPRRYPSSLRQWEDFIREFEDQPLTPGMPDLPVRRMRPVSLLTWTDALKLNLLGKDQFFGTPGQPPANFDFPNPRGPRASIDLRFTGVDLMQSVLAPTVPMPFAQDEWLVPRGATPAIALRTWIDPLKYQLIGQDAFYGPPGFAPAFVWPMPLIKRAKPGFEFGFTANDLPVYPDVHIRRSIRLPAGGIWLVDPDDLDWCEVVFADVLPAGVTLSSVAYTLPNGLTLMGTALDISGGRAAVLIAGATHGSMNHIIVAATLSNTDQIFFTAPLRGFNG